MSHNVNQFASVIAQGNEFLRPNQFELSIPGMPQWSQGKYDGRFIQYRCNSASLPGVNINSIDNRRYGMGPLEYYPTGVSFFDLNTTFYADQDAEIVKFFQEWTRNTVRYDPKEGPEQRFRVAYRDKYISQIVVTQYNIQGEPVLDYHYVDAFPVLIQPIGVRWFSKDEITEFDVTWKYKTWTEKSVGEGVRVSIPTLTQPSLYTGNAGLVQSLY